MVTIAASLLLAGALATDLRRQRIPNGLTAMFFAGGLAYHGIEGGVGGIASACLGAAAGFVPLLLLYFAKGIGAGDVKLFGAVGAWIGVWEVLRLLMYSFLYAGLIAILLLGVRRIAAGRIFGALGVRLGRRNAGDDRNAKDKPGLPDWMRQGNAFPFMLAVAPAALTVWLLLD